ncbi:MAG: hypothetical protein ABIG10_01935 [bacterium]
MNLFGKNQKDQLKHKLSKHQGTEGMSTKHLDFGLWYIQHRKHFFIGIIVILFIVSFYLWGFSLYYFGDYILRGMTAQREALIGLTQGGIVHQDTDYAQNVKQQFIKIIPLSNSLYDLVGSITNANEDLWIEFDYYYTVNNEKTEMQHGFVFPEENKFLLSLNQRLSGQPLSANLAIENIQWRRINAHKISDWPSYKLEYLNFIVKDKSFIDSEQSGLTENLKLNRLSFLINNQTAYSYYEAPLNIVIYDRDNVVAATRYLLNNFESREKRIVEISLLGHIPRATRLDIMLDINILDESVFMPIQ